MRNQLRSNFYENKLNLLFLQPYQIDKTPLSIFNKKSVPNHPSDNLKRFFMQNTEGAKTNLNTQKLPPNSIPLPLQVIANTQNSL
jgi:hypothetical protein